MDRLTAEIKYTLRNVDDIFDAIVNLVDGTPDGDRIAAQLTDQVKPILHTVYTSAGVLSPKDIYHNLDKMKGMILNLGMIDDVEIMKSIHRRGINILLNTAHRMLDSL